MLHCVILPATYKQMHLLSSDRTLMTDSTCVLDEMLSSLGILTRMWVRVTAGAWWLHPCHRPDLGQGSCSGGTPHCVSRHLQEHPFPSLQCFCHVGEGPGKLVSS